MLIEAIERVAPVAGRGAQVRREFSEQGPVAGHCPIARCGCTPQAGDARCEVGPQRVQIGSEIPDAPGPECEISWCATTVAVASNAGSPVPGLRA